MKQNNLWPSRHTCLLRQAMGLFFCFALLAVSESPVGKSRPLQAGHGMFQVRRLLSDRGQMSSFANSNRQTSAVAPEDAIFGWLVEKFDGANIGTPVLWDDTAPANGQMGEHQTAVMGQPATVRIKELTYQDGLPNSIFEKLWFAAVFEMCNLENQTSFMRLFEQAAVGSINQKAFVEEAARLEHRALSKVQSFYHNVWTNWANSRSFLSDKRIWEHGWKRDFADWLSTQHISGSGYPASAFNSLFDWCVNDYSRFLSIQKASSSSVPQKAVPAIRRHSTTD